MNICVEENENDYDVPFFAKPGCTCSKREVLFSAKPGHFENQSNREVLYSAKAEPSCKDKSDKDEFTDACDKDIDRKGV